LVLLIELIPVLKLKFFNLAVQKDWTLEANCLCISNNKRKQKENPFPEKIQTGFPIIVLL
jgi:hypothetical protein